MEKKGQNTTHTSLPSMDKNMKEPTVEEKLRSLYTLQLIDSRIDQIVVMRGELPVQVRDLEDEITGLHARLKKHEDRISDSLLTHKNKKSHIAEAKKKSKQYDEQQKNIKNEREFNSIRSEMEYQDLDIQLTEKQIKTLLIEIENLKVKKDEVIIHIQKQNDLLKEKKKELSEIMIETEVEEEQLEKLSKKMSENVDHRLLQAYQRIRKSSRNGLVVVPVHRQASIGSYILIPPQRQIEVSGRNKIIIDEHSGRILIDMQLAEEQKLQVEELLKNLSSFI